MGIATIDRTPPRFSQRTTLGIAIEDESGLTLLTGKNDSRFFRCSALVNRFPNVTARKPQWIVAQYRQHANSLAPNERSDLSSDRYENYYYLTRDGWQTATSDGLDSAPSDWVRFYQVDVNQGSPFGPTGRTWKLLATKSGIDEAAADELEQSYPRPESQKISAQDLGALLQRMDNK